MPAARVTVTPDHELVTPEAILFRIEQLRKQPATKAMYNRIMALKARLPKNSNEPVKPAVDPNLLVSKSDLSWGVPTRTCCEEPTLRKDDLYKTGTW